MNTFNSKKPVVKMSFEYFGVLVVIGKAQLQIVQLLDGSFHE